MKKCIFVVLALLMVVSAGCSMGPKKPLIIAHRGVSATYPENTLPSFKRALELEDVYAIEFDIHPTRDGKLVLIHDNTVDRTSNGGGVVRESVS